MEKDPFKEYLRESEPDKAGKGYAWSTATRKKSGCLTVQL